MRRKRAYDTFRSRMMPVLGHSNAYRASVTIPVERHRTTHRGKGKVGRVMVRVWPSLPERRNGHMHNVGPHGSHFLKANTHAIHHLRARVLNHKIGSCYQPQKLVSSGFGFEINDHAALTAVVSMEAQIIGPRIHPIWRLDLQDICSESREDETGKFRPRIRQIKHAVRSKHRSGIGHAPCSHR